MFLRLLSLLSVCLFIGNSQAADTPLLGADRFASPYDVEIVIFERFGQGKDEYWPQDPGVPDPGLAAGDLRTPGLQGPGAVLLPDSARQLGPEAYTLKQKGALIHEHLVWRQDVKGRNSNTWYRVGGQRLGGLIRVSKGRYLHLDTDLLLKPDGANSYRIRLHRRMRSGELHYVDHPKIGVLIRTARVVTATPPEPDKLPETDIPDTLPPVDEPGEQRSPTPGSLPRSMPDPT